MPTTQNTVIDTVTFDNTQLCIIEHDDKPWLAAADLARALGYSDQRSITKVYSRNEDEFSDEMTMVVKLTTSADYGGSIQKTARIFSPRGCHLIAMFARTEKAKLFRKWVLDVLEHYQFGDGHGTPVFAVDEPHTLDGHMPSILPIKFNGDDVPFTFYGGRYWLNAYNLGRLVGMEDHKANKRIKEIWYRNKNDMPEDGSRLITWCRIGRTSGERVFDLTTSAIIANKAGKGDYGFAVMVWLQNLANNQAKHNNILPYDFYDHVCKAKALNQLMADHELGERAHIHGIIDGLLAAATPKIGK